MYKTDNTVEQHLCGSFANKMPLRDESFLENMKYWILFVYAQCDNEVSDNLRETFAKFPSISKNINVGRDDIGPFMKKVAEKEENLTQPRRMLKSSYFLENGKIITPLLLFYLDLGLVCKKTYRLVQYTPIKCFKNFVQSPVNARKEGDKNTNSSVVAETLTLLANSSYGYQIMDRSWHTVAKCIGDEKIHRAIINKMFKRLGYINDQL